MSRKSDYCYFPIMVTNREFFQESLNSEDLSLSQSMDHDITDDIIDRVEEEQRNRMMNPFKPDTTVPPFFPA
jgi:hypothetical protein